MWWHAESDNAVLGSVLIKLWRSVDIMAVLYKKTIDFSRRRRGKVLEIMCEIKLRCSKKARVGRFS
jgi:hypothetical protein